MTLTELKLIAAPAIIGLADSRDDP